MARRAGLLDSLRRDRGEPLLLEGGDFLGTGVEGDRERAAFIFGTMERMGYRVATVGERELGFGWEFIRELAREHNIALVVANLYDAEGEKRLASAYVIEQVGDMQVGIFGVLSPDLTIRQLEEGEVPQISDPVETAAELVPRMREHCDLVVGLLHMAMPSATKLLGDVPGIDMAVVGHDPGITHQLERVAGTTIVRTGSRGQRVAVVELAPGEAGDPPSMQGEIVLLSDQLPEDAELAALIERTDKEIRQRINQERALRVAEREMDRGGDRFLGDATCQRCHLEIYGHWQGTRHARAFETLKREHDDKDEDCLACHTTGYDLETGFEDAHASPDLSAVQCEACHGMGTYHGPDFAQAARERCEGCHTADWSPDFDADSAWRLIRHPEEERLTRTMGSPW